MYDFGQRLKSIRKLRGLTQKMLAERINKSVSAISGYELDAQIPPIDVLESMAVVLNVSLDYLVGIENADAYSARNLNDQQKEILDLLYEEFSSPNNTSSELTPQQIRIIQKLLSLFSSK